MEMNSQDKANEIENTPGAEEETAAYAVEPPESPEQPPENSSKIKSEKLLGFYLPSYS